MRMLLASLFFTLSGSVSAQYFNIFPSVCDTSVNGGYHYTVNGIEAFSGLLTLNVELLEDSESLTAIDTWAFVFEDSLSSNFNELTRNISEHTFSIDLGSYTSNNYLLHMWVLRDAEVYDEIYYKP